MSNNKTTLVFHGNDVETLTQCAAPTHTLLELEQDLLETWQQYFSDLSRDEYAKIIFEAAREDIEKMHAPGYVFEDGDFVNLMSASVIHPGFRDAQDKGDNFISWGMYQQGDGRFTVLYTINAITEGFTNEQILEAAAYEIQKAKAQADAQVAGTSGEVRFTNQAKAGWGLMGSGKRNSLNTNSRPKKKKRKKRKLKR